MEPIGFNDIPIDIEVPQLQLVCPNIAFRKSLEVSPDENQVCFIAPDDIVVAYESGTIHRMWSLATSSDNSICSFVGNQRLLVLTKQDENFLIQLVNTDNGSVIDKTLQQTNGIYGGKFDSDPRTGLFIRDLGGGSSSQLLLIQVNGDKIKSHTIECGQVFGGPKIGPDGKVYVIRRGLDRIEDNLILSEIARGGMQHCIYFASKPELPLVSTIYCGGGYSDRSGYSNLYIIDPNNRTDSTVDWEKEPIQEISPAGKEQLLIASFARVSMGRTVNEATLSLFSVKNKKKDWSFTVYNLESSQSVVLASMPEEGLALIQTGYELKLVTIENGNVIRVLPKQKDEYAIAKWLPLKRHLYIARNPDGWRPGIVEYYSIGS